MPSEYRSCKKKRRFGRDVIAQKQLNRGMREGHYSEDYHIYECRYCSGFHIGKDKFYYQNQEDED